MDPAISSPNDTTATLSDEERDMGWTGVSPWLRANTSLKQQIEIAVRVYKEVCPEGEDTGAPGTDISVQPSCTLELGNDNSFEKAEACVSQYCDSTTSSAVISFLKTSPRRVPASAFELLSIQPLSVEEVAYVHQFCGLIGGSVCELTPPDPHRINLTFPSHFHMTSAVTQLHQRRLQGHFAGKEGDRMILLLPHATLADESTEADSAHRNRDMYIIQPMLHHVIVGSNCVHYVDCPVEAVP